MNSSALIWKSSGKVLKMKEGYLFMLILLNSWDLELNPGLYRRARKVSSIRVASVQTMYRGTQVVFDVISVMYGSTKIA